MSEIQTHTDRLIFAVKECMRFNGIRNDLDAYLWGVCKYGIGITDQKPNPNDFGLPECEEHNG